jgi:hypothetical protein
MLVGRAAEDETVDGLVGGIVDELRTYVIGRDEGRARRRT